MSGEQQNEKSADNEKPDAEDRVVTTRHSIKINGRTRNYMATAGTLRKSMSINPYLKVFVANGRYDLTTPYMATRYTFDHLGLDPSLEENISMAYYEAGQMMYIHLPSLARLKDELARFVNETSSAS